MKIAVLLTARAGSKSVPNKNLYRLNNIPLYLYNVSYAIECNTIQRIYISTDSEEIINDCRKSKHDKLKLIVRPAALCQDDSSHYDTIIHGLNEIEKIEGQLDMLVVLLGNAPHAYPEDLTKAIQGLITCSKSYDSCMSVSKMNMFNPFRAVHQLENGSVVPVVNPKIANFLANRKNQNDKDCFGDIYFFNGGFWICKRETLLKNDGEFVFPWLGKRIMPYFQPDGLQEVDAEWQLKLL